MRIAGGERSSSWILMLVSVVGFLCMVGCNDTYNFCRSKARERERNKKVIDDEEKMETRPCLVDAMPDTVTKTDLTGF